MSRGITAEKGWVKKAWDHESSRREGRGTYYGSGPVVSLLSTVG